MNFEPVIFPSIVIGVGTVFGMAEREPGQAQDFFAALDTGEMLNRTDPVYQLRKVVMRYKSNARTFRLRPETIVFLIIKAWNLYVNGEETHSIRIGGREKMPLVDGFDPTVLPFYREQQQAALTLD